MKVAVLGCGPSGLLAAHAAELIGHKVQVISHLEKSIVHGAMYLHQSIEGVTSEHPDGDVMYEKEGFKAGYARKVYGSPWAVCSWDHFPTGRVDIWSMKLLYDKLWDRYLGRILNQRINAGDIDYIEAEYDMVISSIPAPPLCVDHDHAFPSQTIWIRSKSEEGPNVITYNGDPTCPWYRRSRLFGQLSLEFGHNVANARMGMKPLGTSCDCHPNVIRVGRFGKWQRGVLVHHAFKEALSALSSTASPRTPERP